MKTLTDHLAQYATYHRDRRNIATHFFGVPAIVLSFLALLSRPSFSAFGLALSPATLVIVLASLFYLRLDRRIGFVMTSLLVLAGYGAAGLADASTLVWLATSAALFIGGWVVQFVGHGFEGRKPAFVDDLVQLAIGPLFVVTEAGFLLGLRPALLREIEAAAGPTRVGNASSATAK